GGLRGRCPVDPLRQLLVHDLLMPGELLHGLRQCRELLLDGGVLRGQRLQHLRTALLLVGGPGLVHQSHDLAPSSSGCARTSLAPGPARTPARVSSPRAAARPASPRLGRLRCRESSAPYPRSCPSSPSSSAAASVAPSRRTRRPDRSARRWHRAGPRHRPSACRAERPRTGRPSAGTAIPRRTPP